MDLTLADQYYLKAMDHYPFCLESVIENLMYALSYDDEHARANCLLGQLYMYTMKDYVLAEACFQRAMLGDMTYPDIYKHYSLLKIWLSDFVGAIKIIEYGMEVRGMDVISLLMHKSLIHECEGDLDQARAVLKMARLCCIDNDLISGINNQLSRIKKKIKACKPNKSKLNEELAVA